VKRLTLILVALLLIGNLLTDKAWGGVVSATDIAKTAACPPDTHAVGAKPPKGSEWKCVDDKGIVNGPWLTWYGNGQLMSERHMKLGKEHGQQRSWWPNGQLMMEGISYEGNRYKGFKYWSITGEPAALDIQTDTITKSVDANKPSGAKP
jgi:hypothetical protein